MKTYIFQDGAEFYYRVPGLKGTKVSKAPIVVRDFDMVAANEARKWFIERESAALGLGELIFETH